MTRQDHPDGVALDGATIALPLVSIVIINFNYGRFLEEVVASALAQSYPHVECIVVDNASTDESTRILEEMERRGDPVHVVRRARNDGQTPASLDGLAVARGAYVIFVDADDVLLPRCVECHVYAHLSLRSHVGFTSGDMLQVAQGQIVVATGEAFNAYVRSGKGLKPDMLRPFRHAPGDETRFGETARRLEGRIHLVPPLHVDWIWAPTSGNCYRRDALVLFADNPALAGLRTGTDMYFGHAIGALSGSALIDEPVFAYRIHGDNIYTRRAQLDRTLSFRPGCGGDSNDAARLAIVDHLVIEAERFAPNIWLKLNLVALLIRLDRPERDPALPRWRRRSRLAHRLAENGADLDRTLGRPLVAFLKFWSGVPPRYW